MTTPTTPAMPATLMTADEFAARHAGDRVELVNGVVQETPMPTLKHGKICATIGRLIGNAVEANDLGHVMRNDSWVRTGSNPDTVRSPLPPLPTRRRWPRLLLPPRHPRQFSPSEKYGTISPRKRRNRNRRLRVPLSVVTQMSQPPKRPLTVRMKMGQTVPSQHAEMVAARRIACAGAGAK